MDILIITRGGGSLEDLWAFNSEQLARKLFQFPKPVISAVGHEIDFSICDFAADLRAPTPSAAAELAVQNTVEWVDKIKKITSSLYQNIQREINYLKNSLQRLNQTLISPQKKLQDLIQKVDELHQRLIKSFASYVQLKQQKAQNLHSLLESFNPFKVLSRGYAIIQRKGVSIHTASDLKIGDDIQIQFARGQAFAHVIKIDLKQGEE